MTAPPPQSLARGFWPKYLNNWWAFIAWFCCLWAVCKCAVPIMYINWHCSRFWWVWPSRHSIFRSLKTDSENLIFGGVRLIRLRCDDVIIYEEASLGSDTELLYPFPTFKKASPFIDLKSFVPIFAILEESGRRRTHKSWCQFRFVILPDIIKSKSEK